MLLPLAVCVFARIIIFSKNRVSMRTDVLNGMVYYESPPHKVFDYKNVGNW
jgi:phage terminase large subunit-like protein